MRPAASRREELAYLRGWRFIKSDFVDFLGLFQLDERFIQRRRGSPDRPREIDITIRGPWLHTILFEIPVLAIVSEVYFRNVHPKIRLRRRAAAARREGRADQRGRRIPNSASPTTARAAASRARGTTRCCARSSAGIGPQVRRHEQRACSRMEHGLTPLGTMAHEYLQACQAVGPRLRDSQVFAFNMWAREYRGDLGIALSDVCGMDAFLRDFDLYFCKLFDGVRHDSGDPFEWGEKLIAHYQKMRIDPRTKTMVFSDSLNVPLAIQLFERFRGRVQTAFGIGTNLTNDLGYEPLQIVIKMTRCNGQPVAKISDEPSKTMDYDPSYVAYLREVFQVPEVPVSPAATRRSSGMSSLVAAGSHAACRVDSGTILACRVLIMATPATSVTCPQGRRYRNEDVRDAARCARGDPDACSSLTDSSTSADADSLAPSPRSGAPSTRSRPSPKSGTRSTEPPRKPLTLEWLVEWLAGKLGVPYLHIDPLKIDLTARHADDVERVRRALPDPAGRGRRAGR